MGYYYCFQYNFWIINWLLLVVLHAKWMTTTAFTISSKTVSSKKSMHNYQLFKLSSSANINNNEWSVTDNWDSLSSVDKLIDDDTIIPNQDPLTIQALKMQNFGMNIDNDIRELTDEEKWLNNIIQDIMIFEPDDIDIMNIKEKEKKKKNKEFTLDEEIMSNEIAMLVRCNENPHNFLLSQGRAVKELTNEERNNINQLLIIENNNNNITITTFFKEAITTIFNTYCQPYGVNGDPNKINVMDATAVAKWMSKSLAINNIGPHDRRVTEIIAKYGSTYGSGFITLEDFTNLYKTAIIGTDETYTNLETLEKDRKNEINAIWNEIRNHNIISPIEFQRNIQLAEIETKYGINNKHDIVGEPNILDECEILYEYDIGEVSKTTDKHGRSSYERVELVPTSNKNNEQEIPVWIRDGEFVFIDEQSCIGCMQCVTAAPSSFQMLEHNGRARTFYQRQSADVKTAVNACPVDCMHFVSYDELKELEIARDIGVDDDHRHFGHTSTRGYIAPTPLHVSRRDSDANHKSSFYHYLRNKCFKSTDCPQRGCYDCPRYKSDPESNPYFKKRLENATHIRAEYFKKTGMADTHRKVEDL